jgi:hypothetical protein
MVYNTSELLDFWTSSIIRCSKKLEFTTFQKLDLFPSSDEGGDTYSLDPLERANVSHWISSIGKKQFTFIIFHCLTINRTSASDCKKFIVSLSKHVLTDSEEAVLMKDFNLSVVNPHSNLDVACAVESIV